MNIKYFGIADEDPFGDYTWSGSSKFFFSSFKKKQLLLKAVSSEPSNIIKNIYKIKNFNCNIDKWKFKYHLDTSFFGQRSKHIVNNYHEFIDKSDVILQIGAWHNLTSKRKLCVSYHDGNLHALLKSPYGYPNINKSIIKKALEYEKKLYDKLDIIFTMSEWLSSSFINDFNIDKNKVVPVYAGINMHDVCVDKSRSYDGNNILFVGKDFERKGGAVLLEAFRMIKKEIKDATLSIVGPSLNVDIEGVKCYGFIQKNETGLAVIKKLYNQSVVFTMPSLYEPFGIAYAEAMAHGLPCVGVNNCAIPEIVIDGKTGLIAQVNDSKDLSVKLIDMLKNRKMLEHMGGESYMHYYNNMRWDVVVDKINSACQNKIN